MAMYECPWCQRKTFSFWQKQTLGPARTLQCSSCSRRVAVSWERAQIAALPLVVLGLLGFSVGKVVFATLSAVLLGGWIGVTLGMLVTAPLYHLYVPLVKPTN
jgi:uncharacterized membrane protein